MPYTVKHLARRFGLSRGALLNHDTVRLLKASRRSAGDYRVFSAEDIQRLKQICIYREAGLPLTEIKSVLDSSGTRASAVLKKRLAELNGETGKMRR